METNSNIVWYVPIQIMNQISSTYTIPENQAHLERLKEDMQKVLMCYSQYANLMRPLDNTLYCNNIGQAYENAREGLPLFVSGAAIKYDIITWDNCIRVYFESFVRNIDTRDYSNIQMICDIYPDNINEIPFQANDYAMITLRYLHTICPVQFASWDFVTDKSDWKYPEYKEDTEE